MNVKKQLNFFFRFAFNSHKIGSITMQIEETFKLTGISKIK